jgi:hypothetical protein
VGPGAAGAKEKTRSASVFDPCAPVRQYLAQVADGGGWKTTIILANTDPQNAQSFTMRLHPGKTDPGAQISLRGERLTDLALVNRTIDAGKVLFLETPGIEGAPLWQGWAEVTSAGAIFGTAVFRKQITAASDSEGAVPLKFGSTERFLLAFDNAAPFVTSMALANPSATQTLTVHAIFRDESGQAILTSARPIILEPSGHIAFALPDQYPELARRRGVAEFVTPGQEVAAMGLRFNTTVNAFSSFETIDPNPGAKTQYVPHIAEGQGWRTSLIVVNTDTVNRAVFDVRFWPGRVGSSTPPLQIEGRAFDGVMLRDVSIGPGGSVTLHTPGSASSPLWQGWAELTTTTGSISGLTAYRKMVPGDQYAEGSVRILPGSGVRLLLPFDNSGGFVTGLAIANVDGTQANTINTTLRDEFGQIVGRRPGEPSNLPLNTNGHDAFAVPDQFGLSSGARGVLDLSSRIGQLVGIGLRFNPRFAFTPLPLLIR